MWFAHPKYLTAKSQFIKYNLLTTYDLEKINNSLPKIMFICGGHEDFCKNRGIIEKYLNQHSKIYITFRAEYAWEVISSSSQVNALSMEEWLADFSDIVVILVESFGTAAELGAFSSNTSLRKKLLPILSNNYTKDLSFINTGPVSWVNNDSDFRPCIHTNFSTILTSMPEIEERLNRKHHNKVSEKNLHGTYKYSKKTLLFFILYIVSSLGPISQEEIIDISDNLILYKDKKNISFILSIGVALELFSKQRINDLDYFTCFDYEKLFRDNQTKKLLYRIHLARAKSLAKLIYIDSFKKMLAENNRYAT